MKLTNPTDDQLNEAFAEKVAGWTRLDENPGYGNVAVWTNPNNEYEENRVWKSKGGQYSCHGSDDGWPDFCSDANSVFPWLQKEIMWTTQGVRNKQYITSVTLDNGVIPRPSVEGRDKCFAKSAVIALLRAHGVEIENPGITL